MPRPATGQIVEHRGRDGRVYRSMRFRAGGKRYTEPLGVVSRDKAETALRHRMADVERGVWTPPAPPPEPSPELEPIPTFHAYAEQWWLRNEARLAAKTVEDYRWRLERHLIPYFGELRLDMITFDTVESYIATKLGEDDPLSPRSINMTLTLLATILEGAVERELITRNTARGRGRRVSAPAPRRSYLESAAQIEALLGAAGELDRNAQDQGKHIERRTMLAVLCFAGLRISELLALLWRDVDLAAGWITVGESKTDAGRRKVKIRGALRDELSAVRSRVGAQVDGYVFPTSTGKQIGPENFRIRVLASAVKRANRDLAQAGKPPLPNGLSPHSLRRTFCSLLYALGEDPGTVLDEMGHTSEALALRIYRQAMRRGEDEKGALRALVEGADWANMGERNRLRACCGEREPEHVARKNR